MHGRAASSLNGLGGSDAWKVAAVGQSCGSGPQMGMPLGLGILVGLIASWHHDHRHGQYPHHLVGGAAQEDPFRLRQSARSHDGDLAGCELQSAHRVAHRVPCPTIVVTWHSAGSFSWPFPRRDSGAVSRVSSTPAGAFGSPSPRQSVTSAVAEPSRRQRCGWRSPAGSHRPPGRRLHR